MIRTGRLRVGRPVRIRLSMSNRFEDPADARRRVAPYTFGMSLPAFNLGDLSPEEKLRLIEQVWDSLAADPKDVPLGDWQVRELDRRLDDLDRDGPAGIPWEQVLREFKDRPR